MNVELGEEDDRLVVLAAGPERRNLADHIDYIHKKDIRDIAEPTLF